MAHIGVKSSNVASYDYDPETKRLEIKYLNGGLYAYKNVPQFKVDALLAHPSFGQGLNLLIKGAHEYEKL